MANLNLNTMLATEKLGAAAAHRLNTAKIDDQSGINSIQRQKINKTANQFEEFFLFQMMELTAPDMSENPVFGGGAAEQMFQKILHEETAKEMVRAGGIGLSPQIEARMLELKENMQ